MPPIWIENHFVIIGLKRSNGYTANGGSVGPTSSFNCNDKKILYAWALNAGELVLPEGAAVPIGGHSNVFQIQVECHYKGLGGKVYDRPLA